MQQDVIHSPIHRAPAAAVRTLPVVRTLRTAELSAAIALNREVGAGVAAGLMLARSDADIARYCSGSAGLAFGVYERNSLVAMGLLRVPSPMQPNLGAAFARVPADDWGHRTAVIEGALVHPRARGRGYQRALLERRRAAAAALGLRWIVAAAHVHNQPSWRNLLAAGFAATGLRSVEHGQVMTFAMAADGRRLATLPDQRVRVPAANLRALQSYLDAGYAAVASDDTGIVCERLVLHAALAQPPARLAA